MKARLNNPLLSPAAADLGLGDALKAQLEAQELERKKKLLQQARLTGTMLSPGASALFPNYGLNV
jgi:hypothetical protein